MKSPIIPALIALVATHGVQAATANRPQTLVTQVEQPLPSSPFEADAFLWDTYAKNASLDVVTLAEWESARARYTGSLVLAATLAGLEAGSLETILKRIDAERGSLAIVPMKAYRTTQGSRDIWVVLCRWEIAKVTAPANARVGHVRVLAYDIATTERVAFATCK